MQLTQEDKKKLFELYNKPFAEIANGLGYKLHQLSDGVFYSLDECPFCGTTNKEKGGRACGILEGQSSKPGRMRHNYTCLKGKFEGSYVDFLSEIGAMGTDQAAALLSALAKPSVTSNYIAEQKKEQKAPASVDSITKRHRALMNHKPLVDYIVITRGIHQGIVEKQLLTMKEEYKSASSQAESRYELGMPVRRPDGSFIKQTMYRNVEGVSVSVAADGTPKPKSYCQGEPTLHFAEARDDMHTRLLICEGQFDFLALVQVRELALREDPGSQLREVMIAMSTHGMNFPKDIPQELLGGWKVIYLAFDNDRPGDEGAYVFSQKAKRYAEKSTMLRVKTQFGKDWNDWLLEGMDGFGLANCLKDSVPVLEPKAPDIDSGPYQNYKAVDLVNKFHEGKLYQCVQVEEAVQVFDHQLERMVDGAVKRRVFINSDREMLTFDYLPAPKDTPVHDRLLVLENGIRIPCEPPTPEHFDWEFQSIQRWLNRKDEPVNLRDCFDRIVAHLRATTWLPNRDDYTVITLGVMASYCQYIFNAVPLYLITGQAGSGKTELTRAIGIVGANSKGLAPTSSPATLFHFINAARGLIALDDVEWLGDKSQQHSDAAQALKRSYKQDSSVRQITEAGRNGKFVQTTQDSFGIKFLNNTSGVDSETLGDRMIQIQTRIKPSHVRVDSSLRIEPATEALQHLKNKLHTWAFTHAGEIHAAYLTKRTVGSRIDEIFLPLHILAEFIGGHDLITDLTTNADRQRIIRDDKITPEKLLREAVEAIVVDNVRQYGYLVDSVTLDEIMMRLKQVVPENYGKQNKWEITELEKRDKVLEMFKLSGMYDSGTTTRKVSWYKTKPLAYRLTDEFVAQCKAMALDRIRQEELDIDTNMIVRTQDPKAFCQGCAECVYRDNCEMRRYVKHQKRPDEHVMRWAAQLAKNDTSH